MGRSIASKVDPAVVPMMTSDEWCTPPEVAEPLFDFWGEADLDPCSNHRSVVRAKQRYETGGLILPWKAKTYENHPYSQNPAWIAKTLAELRARRVHELVILCMCAPSTQWWASMMTEPRRNPRVIATKRIKFLGPDGTQEDSSRFDPALIYVGKHVAKFDRHFRHLAMWSTWGR